MICKRFLKNSRGSVLFLTVILSGFLSVLLLLATDSFILAAKAMNSFEKAIQLFYIAEAGLSHGHAYCLTNGCETAFLHDLTEGPAEIQESAPHLPFYQWIPYGNGSYYIEVFQLNETYLHPLINRDSGVLVVVTARFDATEFQKQLCLLLDEPPDWTVIAWWEPE